MKQTKHNFKILNKIQELDAQIGLNEMIIEDCQHDKEYCKCLETQNTNWINEIAKQRLRIK